MPMDGVGAGEGVTAGKLQNIYTLVYVFLNGPSIMMGVCCQRQYIAMVSPYLFMQSLYFLTKIFILFPVLFVCF